MHAGEADLFLVLIYWGIIHLTYNFFKKNELKPGYLIAFLIAIASQVKQEGVLMSSIFLFLPSKLNNKLIWIGISVLPSIIWSIIRVKSGLIADFGYAVPGLGEFFTRLIDVCTLTVKEMLNLRNWYIFWPLFWFSLVFVKKKNKFFGKIIIPTLFSLSALFLANYMFSTLEPSSYVSSSIDRILLQLSPFYYSLWVFKSKSLNHI